MCVEGGGWELLRVGDVVARTYLVPQDHISVIDCDTPKVISDTRKPLLVLVKYEEYIPLLKKAFSCKLPVATTCRICDNQQRCTETRWERKEHMHILG